MKFIIKETGEERELHFYRPKIIEDMVDELIGNSGAVGDYIAHIPGADLYTISRENYQWWAEYLEMAGRWEDQLDELRARYGADAVTDVIVRLGLELGPDYTRHDYEYSEIVRTVRDALEVGDDEA